MRGVAKILVVLGAFVTVFGLIMIPLPGPGFLVLVPGLFLLVVGAALYLASRADRVRSHS